MKRIKMCLYGEPGVGKSVFASKAPKPFFICTDGNYEWLEDFGAKMEDHAQVSSWDEAKKIMNGSFDDYETIVIDLTEDLFKWCEQEFCIKNRISHVGDLGFGKGYDISRNEFFIEMCKLINLDKNIIFLMHETTTVVKDRRGVEHTKHMPSSRIPEKVIDMLEGRVRYFLRCYLKAEETEDNKLVKKRYLSLIPKENEFGICRGVDENRVPHDIPLEFEEFIQIIGLEKEVNTSKQKNRVKVDKKPLKVTEQPIKDQITIEETISATKETASASEEKETSTVEEAQSIGETEEIKEPVVQPIENRNEVETKVDQTEEEKPKSNADKLAAIKAKLAALKNNK